MVATAAQNPGGIRAYALRDTFARLINPGAVARVGTIEAIKQSQGVPDNAKAYLLNLRGDGNVPKDIAQQILNVSHGFLAAHYGSARSINDSYGQQATRAGLNPLDATVPMDALPGNVQLDLPGRQGAEKSLIQGDIYFTAKGPAVWNGTNFVKFK
jgi:hypothetical protein